MSQPAQVKRTGQVLNSAAAVYVPLVSNSPGCPVHSSALAILSTFSGRWSLHLAFLVYFAHVQLCLAAPAFLNRLLKTSNHA
jgi:hypothetical protein